MRASTVKSGVLLVLVVLWGAVLGSGCLPGVKGTKPVETVEPAPPPPVEKQKPPEKIPKYHIHKVRWPGESLSIIAKWYTGAADSWKVIAEHNSLQDPDRIGLGDEIIIPEYLITTGNPMPREFVDRHQGQAADPVPPEPPPREPVPAKPLPPEPMPAESAPPEPLPPEPVPHEPVPGKKIKEAPELFGPKEFKGGS